MTDIFLFDNFFLIAAALMIFFFSVIAWQLARVRMYFLVAFLPIMVFGTYIIAKEVYDHFGMPTANLPKGDVIMLWYHYDSPSNMMYLLAIVPDKRKAIPKYYAFKWADEKKEELRKATEESERKNGIIIMNFKDRDKVEDDSIVVYSEKDLRLQLPLPKKRVDQ